MLLRVQRPLGLAGSSRLPSLEGRSSRSRITSTSVRRSCLHGMHYMASASRMSADIDRWVTFQHFAVPRRVGSQGWSEKGEGRPCARGSETVKGNRGRERKKWWGFSARAAAPRFFSPGTEKGGPYAPYVGGERACAGCATTCVGLRPSNKCVAHIGACVRACVRTLPAITASCTGSVGRGRLCERQSDLGNLMRN